MKYQKWLAFMALGLLFMPVLPFLVPANATSSSLQLEETEFQLAVEPAAPKLPANRQTYYGTIQLQVVDTGNPIEAPQDLEITLISSDPSVVSMPQDKLTLKAGDSMVKAELLTTDKAGIASVTALAEGVKSATASMTTYRMDSLEPTRLALNAAPSSFIADPKYTGMIYIQVLNSQNLPAVSKNDIAVDLSSSNPTIGKVPSYVVIPPGKSGVLVDFTPEKQTGQTQLRASAPGLAPGELSVAVSSPVATKLLVEFAPDVIPAINYYDSIMTVQLTDQSDLPVNTARNINVLLKSSDTTVVQVPPSIVIPAGRSYASVVVEAKGSLGLATVTATASGYETGFNTIEAVKLSNATTSDPKVLQLYTVPSVLPPDNSEHQAIVVAFRDENGQPYRQTGYLYSRIALSTSNTQVGEISSTSFTAKETYALAKFTTNYVVGETTLTASLEGHQPSQTLLTVDGSGPAAVKLTQIPSIIEANNFGAESLAINLVDHYGKPVAAQKDTLVYLSSSDPEITRVDASATIPAGESHVTAKAYTTLRWGQTTITGAADGLGSGSLNFRTVGFTGSISEYHLGLYTIPKIPADGREYEGVVVQLQDQSGLPVLAKSDIDVSLSSSSTKGLVQDHVVIPAGQSLVTATIRTTLEDSTFKITASSQGYTSVEAEIESTLQPLTIFRDSAFPARADYGIDIPVAVDVYSRDIPVRDATVTVTGNSAREMIVMTDESGHAEGLYVPTLPGSNSIVVRVNKPGYEEETLTSRISLIHTVNVVINAESEGGNELAAQLKIEGPSGTKNLSTKPGNPLKFENSNWGLYKFTAPPQVKAANAVYNFVEWSDGATENPRSWTITEDTQITAVYNASYLVQISDPNGMARGTGYYDEGTNARISMSQDTIGGILIDKSFAGWSGDIKSSSATTDVLVDGPKTIKAEWSDSYLKIALIIAAAAGGGFYYYWKIFKPKREMEAKQRAPDLDWYKT